MGELASILRVTSLVAFAFSDGAFGCVELLRAACWRSLSVERLLRAVMLLEVVAVVEAVAPLIELFELELELKELFVFVFVEIVFAPLVEKVFTPKLFAELELSPSAIFPFLFAIVAAANHLPSLFVPIGVYDGKGRQAVSSMGGRTGVWRV